MKTRNFIVILLASVGMCSCSEDIMQEINKNVNNPSDMQARLIITDMIYSAAYSVVGSDLAWYASVFTEYNVGIWNQMYNAEVRVGEPINATTYNNSWNTIYRNMMNLKTVIAMCSPGGVEENNVTVLGMAQVLMALHLATLTDLMGDVPWSEALQPGDFLRPKLDKQSDIYVAINEFLNDGIESLQKTSTIPAIGGQDPIYAGVASRWLKFAYGLKARYAMRLSKISPNYDAVLDAVSKSFTAKSEEARLTCNATMPRNPFYKFYTDRDYFGASRSLLTKLEDHNDPRVNAFFQIHPSGSDLIFAPNGNPNQVQGHYATSKLNVSAPVFVMSYHELLFLKAEAYARKNDLANARTALREAITTSFTNWGLTAAAAGTYFDNTVLLNMNTQAEAIKEVMFQKYIGLFEGESIETYCDIRRLRAMGEGSTIPLANTRQFPLRFTYGAQDVTANVHVREAYGDGTYVYSENVWWAGGSR